MQFCMDEIEGMTLEEKPIWPQAKDSILVFSTEAADERISFSGLINY